MEATLESDTWHAKKKKSTRRKAQEEEEQLCGPSDAQECRVVFEKRPEKEPMISASGAAADDVEPYSSTEFKSVKFLNFGSRQRERSSSLSQMEKMREARTKSRQRRNNSESNAVDTAVDFLQYTLSASAAHKDFDKDLDCSRTTEDSTPKHARFVTRHPDIDDSGERSAQSDALLGSDFDMLASSPSPYETIQSCFVQLWRQIVRIFGESKHVLVCAP